MNFVSEKGFSDEIRNVFLPLAFRQGRGAGRSCFMNLAAKTFGVADGNSAAYSSSNPPIKYPGGLTGGQVAVRELCAAGHNATPETACWEMLESANRALLWEHQKLDRDPRRNEDVGGACFACCQFNAEGFTAIVAGDCFVLWEDEGQKLHMLTNFDQAAYELEQWDENRFAEHLKTAQGDKGRAWELYFPEFQDKRIRCANKKVGEGGYALLNGDPEMGNCWTHEKIAGLPKWLLMGTDGIVPTEFSNPVKRMELIQRMADAYLAVEDFEGLEELRDRFSFQPHIGRGQWPEATVMAIHF